MNDRILLISARSDYGGGPRHIELILKGLSQKFEFHITCPKTDPYWEIFQSYVGNRIIEIPHRKFSLERTLSIASHAVKNNINLLHSHGKGGGLYARVVSRLTGIPWIHTPHGIHTGEYGKLKKNLYQKYENHFLKVPDLVIFVSKEEQIKASTEQLWTKTRFRVIPNGVPSHSYAEWKNLRSYGRKMLGLKDNQKVVITISRFNYQKNMAEAFQVATELPSVHFIWIGDGPDKPALFNESLKRVVNNLTFMGSCDNPLPFLAAADIYLSTSRWEGLPLSLLEAMSVGTPVVASNVVGHREIFDGKPVGQLYPLGEPQKAMEIILYLLANKEYYDQLRDNALEKQRSTYSTNKMKDQISEAYRLFLSENY